MKKQIIAVIATISGVFLLGGLAIAKGFYASHGGHRGHHGRMGMLCQGGRDAKLAKMTDALTSKLNLNEDQIAKWGAVTAVIQQSDFESVCNFGKDGSNTAPDKLKQMETAMTTGLETVQQVQAPFNTFYTSLDADQQSTLNEWMAHRGRPKASQS